MKNPTVLPGRFQDFDVFFFKGNLWDLLRRKKLFFFCCNQSQLCVAVANEPIHSMLLYNVALQRYMYQDQV